MTKKNKCEHKNINIEVFGTQDVWIDENGNYNYDAVENAIFDAESKTAVYCKDCDKYLTKKEIKELNLE